MRRWLIAMSVAASLCMVLWACTGDEPEKVVGPTVPVVPEVTATLDRSMFNVDARRQDLRVEIQTGGSWQAKADCGWLKVDSSQGEGNAVLSIDCYENTTKKVREGHVDITAAGRSMVVTVRQQGLPLDTAHYVSHRAIMGNRLKEEKCYLEVTFDKPVTLKTLYSSRYLITLAPEYSEDRCTLRQELQSAAIGLDVAATLSVASDDGVMTMQSLTFSFYDQCFRIGRDEGQIVEGTWLSEDEQSVWISRTNPSELLQVSLADGEVLTRTAMPFAPGVITHNPYNGKLYVLPSNHSADLGWASELCVVSPANGKIEKTIGITPSPNAHPQFPPIFPIDLQFTADGMGILVLGEKMSDGLEWRYLDSADDDKLTCHDYGKAKYNFEHVYASYDRKSVWANGYPRLFSPIYQVSRTNPEPKVTKLDPQFRDHDYYYAGGTMACMLYHRYRNSVFIASNPGCQCVIDLDRDVYSKTTPAEGRGAVAAWDYSQPERNLVYYVGGLDNNFLLLDMDVADALFYAKCTWGSNEIMGIYHLVQTDRLLIVDCYGGVFLQNVDKMKFSAEH